MTGVCRCGAAAAWIVRGDPTHPLCSAHAAALAGFECLDPIESVVLLETTSARLTEASRADAMPPRRYSTTSHRWVVAS